jgi:hypothetical protein
MLRVKWRAPPILFKFYGESSDICRIWECVLNYRSDSLTGTCVMESDLSSCELKSSAVDSLVMCCWHVFGVISAVSTNREGVCAQWWRVGGNYGKNNNFQLNLKQWEGNCLYCGLQQQQVWCWQVSSDDQTNRENLYALIRVCLLWINGHQPYFI